MARERKGGSGRKGTLKDLFKYYKDQLFRRLIDEEAYERAMGGGADLTPSILFKRLNYKSIFEEGLTRKVNNKTIRYYGEEAIKIQIESLKKRSSKSEMGELFIKNFIEALGSNKKDSRGNIIGLQMPDEYIKPIEYKLRKISIDKLTYLLRNGILKVPTFYYANPKTWEELYDEIVDAIDNGVSKERIREVRQKRKELRPHIKGLFETMYKW